MFFDWAYIAIIYNSFMSLVYTDVLESHNSSFSIVSQDEIDDTLLTGMEV